MISSAGSCANLQMLLGEYFMKNAMWSAQLSTSRERMLVEEERPCLLAQFSFFDSYLSYNTLLSVHIIYYIEPLWTLTGDPTWASTGDSEILLSDDDDDEIALLLLEDMSYVNFGSSNTAGDSSHGGSISEKILNINRDLIGHFSDF